MYHSFQKIVLFILLLWVPGISFCQDSIYAKFQYTKGHWKIPEGAELKPTPTHFPLDCYHSMPTSNLNGKASFMVHSFYYGEVIAAYPNDEQPFVIIKTGKYFLTYVGFENLLVKKGDLVKKDQLLGKTAKYYDNSFNMEIYLFDSEKCLDPDEWFDHSCTLRNTE